MGASSSKKHNGKVPSTSGSSIDTNAVNQTAPTSANAPPIQTLPGSANFRDIKSALKGRSGARFDAVLQHLSSVEIVDAMSEDNFSILFELFESGNQNYLASVFKATNAAQTRSPAYRSFLTCGREVDANTLRHLFHMKYYDPKTEMTEDLMAEVKAKGHPGTITALLSLAFSIGDPFIIDAMMSCGSKPAFVTLLRTRDVADSSIIHLVDNWYHGTVVVDEAFILTLICCGKPKAVKMFLTQRPGIVQNPAEFFRILCRSKYVDFDKTNSGIFGRVEDSIKEFIEFYPAVRHIEPSLVVEIVEMATTRPLNTILIDLAMCLILFGVEFGVEEKRRVREILKKAVDEMQFNILMTRFEQQ